jgi:uncharacterized membrane protein YsdA (DUF1294 family)
MRIGIPVYLIIVAITSLWALVAYGIDKRRAQAGTRRIPEANLHLIALVGGWPGALAAQRLFRHKTQKLGFQIVFWLLVMLHLGLVGSVVYFVLWRMG